MEFQLQHQSFQLISFRIDWFDLLAVPGTLKRLLQHYSSKTQSRGLCVCPVSCEVFLRVTLLQRGLGPEGPRHLHRMPRLSEAPWEVP